MGADLRQYPPESVHPASVMTPEYRTTLLRVLANHARAEQAAANGYFTWAPRIPDPATRVHLAELAREETGHWSGCVRVLEELGIRPTDVAAHASRSWFYGIARLIAWGRSWTDAAVASYLFERVGYIMVEEYVESSYAPHAVLARQILQEEATHPDAGVAFLRGIAGTEGHEAVRRAFRRWWPMGLNAFGPSGAPRIGLYIRLGLKHRTNDERRQAFVQACEPALASLGLEIPRLRRTRFPFV